MVARKKILEVDLAWGFGTG